MSFLFALSLSTGICCGIWAAISSISSLHLITWMGFAGCTAYFASGKHGKEGVLTAIASTLSGVISAMVAVYITSKFPTVVALPIIMTGIISCTMCLQSVVKTLWFIPGAFIGCFSTFAYLSTGANIFGQDLVFQVISLILGAFLALSCDKGGELLFKLVGKKDN